jgi:UPF0716 protein FxsA
MTPTRMMLAFIDRDFLFRLILVFLAYALIPLGEILLFVYIGTLVGNYLVLVLAVLVGVGGAVAGLGQIRRSAAGLRALLAKGSYAGPQVAEMASLAAAGILLVTPGFLTDIAGLLLLVPSIRVWAVRRFASLLKKRYRDVWERLRLSEL